MNDLEFYEANFYADIMPVTETQLLALGDRPILFRKKFMAKARLVVQRSAYSYQSWLTEQVDSGEISPNVGVEMLALNWSAHQVRYIYVTLGPFGLKSWDGEKDLAELGGATCVN